MGEGALIQRGVHFAGRALACRRPQSMTLIRPYIRRAGSSCWRGSLASSCGATLIGGFLSAALLLFSTDPLSAVPQTVTNVSLHGHVYDDKGTPAAGANVTITDHASGFRNRVASITTDEHGGFSASLQWGNLTIDVMKTGYVVEYVQDIQPDKDIIVHLRRAGGVRGRVSDADGRPLREAFVEVVAKSYIN